MPSSSMKLIKQATKAMSERIAAQASRILFLACTAAHGFTPCHLCYLTQYFDIGWQFHGRDTAGAIISAIKFTITACGQPLLSSTTFHSRKPPSRNGRWAGGGRCMAARHFFEGEVVEWKYMLAFFCLHFIRTQLIRS